MAVTLDIRYSSSLLMIADVRVEDAETDIEAVFALEFTPDIVILSDFEDPTVGNLRWRVTAHAENSVTVARTGDATHTYSEAEVVSCRVMLWRLHSILMGGAAGAPDPLPT